MKILLLGAQGQVGSELRRSIANLGDVVALSRYELNFESSSDVKLLLRQEKPDIVINAAAYTQVDKAESEPELAHRVNVDAVEVLVQEVKNNNGYLIHFSTDYVFDGQTDTPYCENDRPHPLNVYGKTKWLSEKIITESGCNHLIFRTSWIHAPKGKNFINTILRLTQEREIINIVSDQYGTPTSAGLVADITALALKKIISSDPIEQSLNGIYHLTAKGMTNWYDYACLIVRTAERLGTKYNGTLNPIQTSDYYTPAIRPIYSVLNTDKLRVTFNVLLPNWELLVTQCITRILSKGTLCNEMELV